MKLTLTNRDIATIADARHDVRRLTKLPQPSRAISPPSNLDKALAPFPAPEEQLIAVLIGKRVDRAPVGAIFLDEFTGSGVGPELVIVPAGEFQMGSPETRGFLDEHPQHRVIMKVPFAVGARPGHAR